MPLSKIQDIGNQVIPNLGPNRNVLINGAMNVVQRSTSETALGADTQTYRTVDRWKILLGNTAGRFTMTQDSSAPSGFANSTKFACTTADTSIAAGEFFVFRQIIEGQNLQQFAKGTSDAKQFAVSFYVKGNASATYNCVLGDEDNTRQSVRQFTVGTDWSRVELIFPADTTGAFDDDNAGSLEFNIYLHAGSDFTSGSLNENVWEARDFTKQASGISSFFDSTNRTFFITGVQLEVGKTVTEFEHRSFAEELSLCHRYFFQEDTNADNIGGRMGIASGTVNVTIPYDMPVQMRAKPSLSLTNANIRVGDMVTAGFNTSSGTVNNNAYLGSKNVTLTLGGFTGLTNYRTYLHEPRTSDGSIGIIRFDAEL